MWDELIIFVDKYHQLIHKALDIFKEELIDNTYDEFVLSKLSDASKKDMFLNGILGLIGELGELVDDYKKYLFQRHSEKDILNESSNMLFYLVLLLNSKGYTLEDCITFSKHKLNKRYSKGFEISRSINKNDSIND